LRNQKEKLRSRGRRQRDLRHGKKKRVSEFLLFKLRMRGKRGTFLKSQIRRQRVREASGKPWRGGGEGVSLSCPGACSERGGANWRRGRKKLRGYAGVGALSLE